jgi:hypothetical protein
VTGTHNDQRELLKMLKALAPGDVVTVTRIDRLARSTFDLFAIVEQIVDAKAQFRSLVEPWADTGTGRLMIAVLGGLADVERDLIRTRTAEGRSRAKPQGQHMGRPRRNWHRPTMSGWRRFPGLRHEPRTQYLETELLRFGIPYSCHHFSKRSGQVMPGRRETSGSLGPHALAS